MSSGEGNPPSQPRGVSVATPLRAASPSRHPDGQQLPPQLTRPTTIRSSLASPISAVMSRPVQPHQPPLPREGLSRTIPTVGVSAVRHIAVAQLPATTGQMRPPVDVAALRSPTTPGPVSLGVPTARLDSPSVRLIGAVSPITPRVLPALPSRVLSPRPSSKMTPSISPRIPQTPPAFITRPGEVLLPTSPRQATAGPVRVLVPSAAKAASQPPLGVLRGQAPGSPILRPTSLRPIPAAPVPRPVVSLARPAGATPPTSPPLQITGPPGKQAPRMAAVVPQTLSGTQPPQPPGPATRPSLSAPSSPRLSAAGPAVLSPCPAGVPISGSPIIQPRPVGTPVAIRTSVATPGSAAVPVRRSAEVPAIGLQAAPDPRGEVPPLPIRLATQPRPSQRTGHVPVYPDTQTASGQSSTEVPPAPRVLKPVVLPQAVTRASSPSVAVSPTILQSMRATGPDQRAYLPPRAIPRATTGLAASPVPTSRSDIARPAAVAARPVQPTQIQPTGTTRAVLRPATLMPATGAVQVPQPALSTRPSFRPELQRGVVQLSQTLSQPRPPLESPVSPRAPLIRPAAVRPVVITVQTEAHRPTSPIIAPVARPRAAVVQVKRAEVCTAPSLKTVEVVPSAVTPHSGRSVQPLTVSQAMSSMSTSQRAPPVLMEPQTIPRQTLATPRAVTPARISAQGSVVQESVKAASVQPAIVQQPGATVVRHQVSTIIPLTRPTTSAEIEQPSKTAVEAIKELPTAPTAEAAPTAEETSVCLSSQDVDEIIRKAFGGEPPEAKSRRPPGVSGRTIELVSNLFPVILPKGNVYHYDVEVRAQGATQEAPVPETIKARCASTLINRQIMETLSRTFAMELDNCRLAFDGRKNVYTTKKLNFIEQMFIVEIEENGIPRQFLVRMRYAATVSMDPIWEMYDKKASPQLFQDAIQAADVILRTGPTLSFVPVGRSFFSSPTRADGDCNLGGGRQLWFGFYTSIRLGVWKPLVNIDMSATAFFVAGPLIQLAQDILDPGRRQANLFNRPLSERDRVTLLKEIRTLKVRAIHQGNQRQYRIENITRKSANEETFDLDGREISVATYFEEKYQLKLKYPLLPCVQVGKRGTMLPIECCEIAPGQHCRRKLSELQTSAMIKKTAVPPRERFRRLMEAARQLDTTAASYCDEFEMKIETTPVKIEARVLDPPIIKYGSERLIKPRDGVWRIDGRFLKPAPMKNWAIAVLGDVRQERVNFVVQQFQKEGGLLGMKISPPILAHPYGNQISPERMLQDIKNKVPDVEMTLIMLSRHSDYGLIKATAETSDLCMRTQCVKDSNVTTKFNGMFAQNLLQKINTKLGGINNGTAGPRPQIMQRPFMCVGIDVNHPGPGDTGTPSVAAVVASMDLHPAQYHAVCSVQRNRGGNRVEWVVGLKAMFLECLQVFYTRNRCTPKQVVVYRDGISEGMFDAVRLYELAELRSACTEFEANFRPSMVFIVVQKRHHVRFMPSKPTDGVGKSGNIPPGVVVDNRIVHPNMFDFYLCSHQGIQGTSRPTHYHVVHDDADNSPDELYQLSYLLCHTYARCARAVSLPAPAYYAHLVAFRAKEHIKGVIYGGNSVGSDSGSSTSSSDSDIDLTKFTQAMKVNKAMRDKMYFV